MIPRNIKRKHILKAIEEASRFGILRGRKSEKYLLEYNGKCYPPKYIISLANKYANKKELKPEEFSGGVESNSFLENLGFKIKNVQHFETEFKQLPKKDDKTDYRKTTHNERCPKCKETIKNLLGKIYGKVEVSPKFEIGTLPEDFKDTPYYSSLKEIFGVLQEYKGFMNFVLAKTLPNCDFFMPDPGFLVEFDESQHFTHQRKMALEYYPESLALGFDKKRWIHLCETINANDNDPPYRDEQRAWYDTLRDFLPALTGLKPTIRLNAREYEWCSLNPDESSDVEKFRRILKGNIGEWAINIMATPNAPIARIIITEPWEGKTEEAKRLLKEIYKEWPKDKKVKFLITCGGFIQFEWPKPIGWEEVGDNKNPNRDSMNALIKEAEKCAKDILSEGVGERLREVADYITLGIDSHKEKISMSQSYISELHIELVLLVNLKTNKFYWTGKSFPTPGQQYGLMRITDLKTHFINLSDIGKAMILGCHDLTMFNTRNMKKTGEWRKRIKREFQQLAEEEKPSIVLHHPHTTVTTGTWRNGWSRINKTLPSVKQYAGAGRYYEPEEDRKKSEYSPLNDVLESTRKGNTIDFVIIRK